MCEMTEELKKRFCKDTNIPIKVFSEPYFANFLALYDTYYNSVAKYKEFCEVVKNYKTEQDYFEEYNKVKDRAITYLNENPVMQHFAKEEDMSKFAVQNNGFPSNTIFKNTNTGKYFVSLDMKKANFTALSHYDKRIVGGKDTYEDFMSMFTDIEYLQKSKYIRQVIFGNINPKRQVAYEKYLMDKVLTKLFENGIERESVEFFATDEIVLNIPSENMEVCGKQVKMEYVDLINNIVTWACEQSINIRAEFFRLDRVIDSKTGEELGYVKQFVLNEKSFELKCFDALILPLFMRYYLGQKENENDRIFLMDGRKAKLLETIEFEVV